LREGSDGRGKRQIHREIERKIRRIARILSWTMVAADDLRWLKHEAADDD
jgi:hypothetical protein